MGYGTTMAQPVEPNAHAWQAVSDQRTVQSTLIFKQQPALQNAFLASRFNVDQDLGGGSICERRFITIF
jgi:hypothetical protein